MYKCPECGEVFDEPNHMEVCWESYYGVGSMFPDKHYGIIHECPYCGGSIDMEEDCWDESYEEEEGRDDRIAYYERQGDEYVYYDENECELYREPA